MSKINNPLMVDIHGHHGGIIYYEQFGQQLTRSMPRSYKDKKSQAQIDQRFGRFKPMQDFARNNKYLSNIIFEAPPANRTKYSEFCSQLAIGFTGTQAEPFFDPLAIVLGTGSLSTNFFLSISQLGNNEFKLSADTNLNNDFDKSTDQLFIILTQLSTRLSILFDCNSTRVIDQCTIDLNDIFSAGDVYMSSPFFRSADLAYLSPFYLSDQQGLITITV